jgi:hypothetical protein
MRSFAQKPKSSQQAAPVRATNPFHGQAGQSRQVNLSLHWQRTIGNQAVQQLLQTRPEKPETGMTGTASAHFGRDFSRIPLRSSAGTIQTKLMINRPGDRYEQEADRVAEQVMRTTEPQGQGPTSAEETVAESGQTRPDSASGGQPIPPATRAFFEPRFGEDFSDVRVHDDPAAHEAAGSIGARAFAFGNQIAFGRGAYSPQTTTGRQLIAHELTHIVQSRGAGAEAGGAVSITAQRPYDLISRQAVTVDEALRQRVRKCVDPFYYDDKGNWSWSLDPQPNCSDVKLPADRARAWQCLNPMYWSRDGTKWGWFGKEPKCDDLVLPGPIEQIRGETPAETKTRKANEEAVRKESERIAKEDAHNINRIAQIKKATSTDVDALAKMFTDSGIKDDGTLKGRFMVIFQATEHWAIPGLQTGIEFGFSGFKKEFHDPWPSSSNQVGHFLTAVRLAMDSSVTDNLILLTVLNAWFDDERALRLIIGHEKRADPGALDMSIGFREQYESTTAADIENFKKGELNKIKVGTGKGNSMADLVLSHKGWLLGRMIVEDKMKTREEVAKWILRVLK